MKKLFSVKDSHNNKVIDFFDDKMKAKALRNELNPERGEDFIMGTRERYYVAKGPDHKDFVK